MKLLRLVKGETVAAVVTEHDNGYLLQKPMNVVSDISSKGHVELLLYPFIPTTVTKDKSITIRKEHVLFMVEMVDSVAKYAADFANSYYDKSEVVQVRDVTKTKRRDAHREAADMLNLDKLLESSNDDDGEDEE